MKIAGVNPIAVIKHSMIFDPDQILSKAGMSKDEDIDLALTALALAAKDHPGVSFDRYLNHLKKLGEDVALHHKTMLSEGGADDVSAQLVSLQHILSGQEGYDGDKETYDDLQNADLFRVIDRRRGMPISLSILYIHAGRFQGWDICGLNIPGHFVCRLEKDGQRLIFDPFERGRILQAQDLRALLKRALGQNAELSSSYYDGAGNRETLIRLQNNLKLRLIEAEDYARALEIIECMRKIDPDEYRLLLDAGVLYARLGQNLAAVRALEGYIDKSPNSRDRQEAALLLQKMRETLH